MGREFRGVRRPEVAIIGFAFQGYHDVVLALLVLSFPARWPTRRIDTALVIGLAVVFAVNSVVRLAVRVPGELLGLDLIDQATAFSLIAVPDLRAASRCWSSPSGSWAGCSRRAAPSAGS